ncbi:NADH-quinone oxidoreductase subunit L [Ferrithrix thermotolerans DSM 19514]|uniref:NADH-quinone oxidoreductase subunit L n=1 Tax=Ferrithrix thermotolerans DSM 19514 TaxID=1121881 RepID=A0A1M4SQD8_9ACTN|nr:NADH-quinone oxidoreductase subunit L [Ferrithrix thermotolerans]SHE34402.1 NADH-quinone oxidoreductase subunit L [Ferrithrix thermotolerans DSM 19514]
MLSLLPYVVGLPLGGFIVLLFFGRRLGRPGAGVIGSLTVGAAFVLSVFVYIGLLSRPSGTRVYVDRLYTWFAAGSLHVNVSLYLDPLSMTMVLFVTGVAFLIHVYSIGYMSHDDRFHQFFVYLNLFVFSMLVLVVGGSIPLTFLGWEGVGTCSYFLIAFWFERPSAASAGKKAFIINRIGDAGFLLGAFMVYKYFGSLSYSHILSHTAGTSHEVATWISLLFFVAAVGKSAQIPLFVWLVDAMEGPTPVSALIHAATMVTAGVFLMARLNPFLALSKTTSMIVAVVGVATALLGATAATSQSDIKKVLAYSTVSQLGFMFLGIGTGAYVAAIFLMVTHAFYKALLFLGAGSVIHGMHDEQDLKKMGALRRFMPVTSVTFVVGWLSIAGVPPFSGFWSKGDVLDAAYVKSPFLWVVAIVAALLTAYYMGRETYLTFYGPSRWSTDEREEHKPHESPKVMTIPLVVLAALAVLGGALNLPFGVKLEFLSKWLAPVFAVSPPPPHVSTSLELILGAVDTLVALGGVGLATSLWRSRWVQPSLEPRVLQKAYYIDSIYDKAFAVSGTKLALETNDVVDRKVIDGAVRAVTAIVAGVGVYARKLQSGYVRSYALAVSLGVVVLLGYMLTRASG